MTAPTVSAGYAGNLMRFALSRGADPMALAERSGIAPDDLSDPDARVPYAGYVALMRAAKDLTGDAALALHLGQAGDLREVSVVGLICYAAPTMAAGLSELNRFGRLVAEVDIPGRGGRFQIEPRDNGLWMVDTRLDPDSFPELTEETWSRFVAETTRHFPGATFARAVHVTHPAPVYAEAYERIMRVPVTFGSDVNAVLIDPSWLDLELHAPNSYVFGVLSSHAQALLDSLEDDDAIGRRIERLLIPLLHTGDLGMDRAAAALGMSRQTLYRRLKAAGLGYEALVDDLRRRMALHYLDGKKVSVSETAYLVGFSDPASFSRAFKRWTGASPRGRRDWAPSPADRAGS
ncbi:MAG: AraC family transcriptional regulator [Caulobacter sp.]|nr:AraC family transcriptional regulator [Caulobacter sp.]